MYEARLYSLYKFMLKYYSFFYQKVMIFSVMATSMA